LNPNLLHVKRPLALPILDSYLDGSLLKELHQQEEKITQDEENLHPEEVKVLAFLKERFAEEVQ